MLPLLLTSAHRNNKPGPLSLLVVFDTLGAFVMELPDRTYMLFVLLKDGPDNPD